MPTSKKIVENEKFISSFRGKKLVRAGNVLCYGNMDDKYIVLMEILDKKEKIKDIEIGSKISIALFNRLDLIKNPNTMFLDFCERNGLYDALETAYAWVIAKE